MQNYKLKLKIYIGADHRGYKLKEKITQWLFEWGYNFEDLGADHLDPKDDYTLFAERVASVVSSLSVKATRGKNENVFGILLCGSGVGVDIVANKYDAVRASVGISPSQVIAGRRDDNMNVLVIAVDFTDENSAQKMVKVFLETSFSKKERFKKRLEDIRKIEANN